MTEKPKRIINYGESISLTDLISFGFDDGDNCSLEQFIDKLKKASNNISTSVVALKIVESDDYHRDRSLSDIVLINDFKEESVEDFNNRVNEYNRQIEIKRQQERARNRYKNACRTIDKVMKKLEIEDDTS